MEISAEKLKKINGDKGKYEGEMDRAMMEAMLETVPTNVMLANRDLVIIYANERTKETLQKLERFLPIPVRDLVGSKIDVFHKNPAFQRKLLSDDRNLPHRATITLGEDKLDLNISAVHNGAGEYVGAMVSWAVVTEKLKLEEEVENQKLLLAALSKAQATIEFKVDGTVVGANDNFLHALGYTAEEIKGKHHSMFCDPAYTGTQAYRDFWAKLNRGEFESGEFKRIAKGGREIWIQASYNPVFDSSGKVVKVVKYASDITKQKLEALKALEEIENQKLLLAALSNAQATIEFKLDGTIVGANENFLRALNYTAEEIKGKHHSMFCDPVYVNSQAYRDFWAKLNRGEFEAGQFKRIAKGGNEIWIQASYNPVYDTNGKVVKVVKYATDITKQKQAIIQLVKSLEETSQQLGSAAEELSAVASQMTKNAQMTSERSTSAAANSEEVSKGVQAVATNTEEMVASVKEISKSSSEAASISKEAMKKANETNITITQLGEASQEIGNVIKVISSIAQQTNLLALNATIEAARAGDAGKGFAVVANEVKELAKQTAKATEDITNKIGAIQESSKGAVGAIGGIAKVIEQINGISVTIAAAVEEQTATTNEVSRIMQESNEAVSGITETVRTVAAAANESSQGAAQTLDAAKSLSQLAIKLRDLVKMLQL